MSSIIPVGIFAASSVVPQIEFNAGVEHLKANGFEPRIESQVRAEHFTFAGSDADRAEAIYRLATDPSLKVLWAARGGYGAQRLLPILEKLTSERGAPPAGKLLVGYSDVTVLHEFVRTRWKWNTLHSPMPAASDFPRLDPREWAAIVAYVRGNDAPEVPWAHASLKWLNTPIAGPVQGELVGGNLALWVSVAGTPWAASPNGKILFLEDVDEAIYRVDRMVVQLEQSGAFEGLHALILGDFTRCNDENNQCLADAKTGAKKPLRKVYEQAEAFQHVFGRLKVPVAVGLPVGHGPNYAPLPLGGQYELTPAGRLKLKQWNWIRATA